MNESVERLVEAVVGKLFIPLEASGRHVHVTKAQAMTLFGHGLTPARPLSQPGQYLAKERLTVRRSGVSTTGDLPSMNFLVQ